MTEALISAFKRNNRKDILAEVLEMTGRNEQAEEVRTANKVTVALIDRTCIGTEPVEVELTYADDTTPARQVELLIEEGDFKAAKKALKSLDREHPNYKRFRKTIKKLIKNA